MPHTDTTVRQHIATSPRPLVVDLDGGLLASSLRWEAIMLYIRRHFLLALLLPLWRCLGLRRFDQLLADAVDLDPAVLPYDRQLIAWLSAEKMQGRPLLLATSAARHHADAVAGHLQLFDQVLAAGDVPPAAHFGAHDYERLRHARPFWGAALLRAMRPRQWLKNLLVFVPMLAGHALNGAALLQSALALVAFSLCASSAYLLNDAVDAADDRRHPTKQHRPIAAGTLPLPVALAASALLAPLSLALCAWCDPLLLLVVLVYFITTVCYSLRLKRLLMVDIVTLAILYSLRILGGGASTHIEPSFWLLTFSFFLFLSLALLKRHSELFNLQQQGKAQTHGRGYTTADQTPVGIMGLNSGFLSVLIFMLYFNSERVLTLYRHPAILMGIVPLLVFWLGRLWTLSFRGEVNEDPLLYVSHDGVSLTVIGACAALVAAASY